MKLKCSGEILANPILCLNLLLNESKIINFFPLYIIFLGSKCAFDV